MARDLRRLSGFLIGAAVQCALASTANAQSAAAGASSGGLEEIVVTAQRREEKLNDVPMTVQVYSQEKLDQQGLKNIDDVTRVSPGITFLRNGSGTAGNYNDEGSDISIRGIDSPAGAATVGVYIDDTPIQTRHLNFGTVMPYPTLFDLERVEVLNGPQGTLFGAGSEGGTIRFITPQPSMHDYHVYARAEYGSIDNGGSNYDAGLAVGGPIIDGVLGFRVSASFREEGGWVNRVSFAKPPVTPVDASGYTGAPGTVFNVYNGAPTITGTTEKNANWHDTATFRLALKWMPTENLSITPSIYAQTLHINDTGAYWLNISDPSSSNYNNGNLQRNPSTDPWYLGAVKVDWNTPIAHIVSNTSYYSRAQHSVSDYSQWMNTVFFGNQYPDPANTVSAYFTDRQDNFSEELRASSVDASAFLQWTAGLYYSHAHENSTETIFYPNFPTVNNLFGLAPGPNGQLYNQPIFSMVDKQVAAFGELGFKLSDQWKFTAGVRASHINYTGVVQESGSLVGAAAVNSNTGGTENPVTPRFVLDYKPSADNLLYASAAKGFRPGGANPQLPPICTNALPSPTPAAYSSDSLWMYEVGTKNTLADRRVQLNAAAYYFKWKDIQQFVYLTCGLGFVPNLGDVTGKGGDIELTWKATDALQVGLLAGYTTSSFDQSEYLVPSTQSYALVQAGNHLPASPWNINANAEYVFTTVAQKPYVRVDYQYATAQRSLVPYQDVRQAPNQDYTLPGLPKISLLSLRAGVRIGGADVSAFVTNLNNFHSPMFVSRDLASLPENYYPANANYDTNYFGRGYPPRTIGVTATYRY